MRDKTYKNSLAKYVHEYMYWKKRVTEHGPLRNDHYEKQFTTMFGLEKAFYTDKTLLDVGCGPCGSLEWADNTVRRVGVDPLAEAYEFLRQSPHAMEYVPDYIESMSFADDTFDVVVSLNSLDHVDDLPRAIAEMKRVVKPGGHLLIAVEVCPYRKPCEPNPVGWHLAEHFTDGFSILDEAHFTFDNGVAPSIERGEPFDHADPQTESGVLRLMLQKNG